MANNLVQRDGTWWVRLTVRGREMRRSTHTTDLKEAERFRDALVGRVKTTGSPASWRRHVTEHLAAPSSWLRRTHSRIVRKSAKRGWVWCMTLEELTALMIASRGRCAITGLPFERRVGPTTIPGPYSISLDRIKASEGYALENCRLVLLAVNLGMQRWGETDMRVIARAIADSTEPVGMFLGTPKFRPKRGRISH